MPGQRAQRHQQNDEDDDEPDDPPPGAVAAARRGLSRRSLGMRTEWEPNVRCTCPNGGTAVPADEVLVSRVAGATRQRQPEWAGG